MAKPDGALVTLRGVGPHDIRVAQATASGVVGHGVWEAGVVLCYYLARTRHGRSLCEGRRVVEIGAGCGQTGIAARLLGARFVLATDIAEVLPHLRRNAAMNGITVALPPALSEPGPGPELAEEEGAPPPAPKETAAAETAGSASSAAGAAAPPPDGFDVARLRWGDAADEAHALAAGPFDTVICGDCCYSEAAVEPLVATLRAFVESRPAGAVTALLAHDDRNSAATALLDAAVRAAFAVRDVSRRAVERALPDDRRCVASAGGAGGATVEEVHVPEALSFYVLTRRVAIGEEEPAE